LADSRSLALTSIGKAAKALDTDLQIKLLALAKEVIE